MTNNFDVMREYMRLENIPESKNKTGDLFFNVMLIRRGKDHPDLPAANYTFKSYYIDSIEKFNRVEDEIIKCCDMFGLRAYISVNVKSKEKFAKYCNMKFSENILNNEYKKPWKVLDHTFGKLTSPNGHRWIVDVDDCTFESEYLHNILNIIGECDSKFDDIVIMLVKTKSGVHVITHSFNIQQFKTKCANANVKIPDIKQNHITLLYENI